MTTTKRPIPFSLEDRRKQAQNDAIALAKLYGSLNKAAAAIGMNRGRLSWIIRGQWRNVAINEIDLVMLATGRAIREKDSKLTNEVRELAQQFQAQMAEVHNMGAALLRVLRKL